MHGPTAAESQTAPHLRRVLGLWDLILFGIIIIQPVAPLPVFGVLSNRGRGHVVTAILLAMVAMACTAISYGKMAQAYPSAGSAFTYVGKEINPFLGYVTGWSMVMDYLLNPIICIIWCSKAAINFLPVIPYWTWVLVFFAVFTGLNLRGVKTSARINAALVTGMGFVVVIFFAAAYRYIVGHPHSDPRFFTRPFYDPATFNLKDVLGGTSIAVLTYIGFDGISTLSEEVENPRRNILLATVLTCVLIGLLSAVEVYTAQLIWPASQPFHDVDTAFDEIAKLCAGQWLFVVVNLTLLVANFGSGMGAQLGAGRLLYGMGRGNALPKTFFGKVDPRSGIPSNSIIFAGLVALLGAYLLSYQLGAEMLNFGALIAFMGVNLAAFLRYYVRATEKQMKNLFLPVLGFVVCLLLWLNLSWPAKIAGSGWMMLGIAYGVWRTHGFKNKFVNFDVSTE